MKLLYSCLLFALLVLFPFASSAEIPTGSITDAITTIDEDSIQLDIDVIARPPHHNTHPVRPGHRPPPPPRPHHYAPRPVYHHYTPVVVYSNPTTVVEEDPAPVIVSEDVLNGVSKFGFGVRGMVAANSGFGNVEVGASGGVGFYFKFRPVRYFSIELINDYLFGTLEYNHEYGSQSYVKVPFVLGGRFHFLDYGHTDVYAALAGSVSVWSYVDGYDYWYDEYTYMYDVGIQFGGQLGVGVSYVANAFEIGMDARYTIESVPDFVPGYLNYYKEKDGVVHGFLLTLNLGFAL